MTSLTEKAIAEVERLMEAATPRPWRGGHRCDGALRATVDGERVSIAADLSVDDAALCASVVNLLPVLLAEIRALREDKAAWEKLVATTSNVAQERAHRIAELVAEKAWRPTHRHIKRGTEYRLIATGRLQTEEPCEDMRNVVVYFASDGRYWVRPVSEFIDGRFETLPVPAPPSDHGDSQKPLLHPAIDPDAVDGGAMG